MKETRRQESKQLSLTLDVPLPSTQRQEPDRSAGASLVRFPRSSPTTSFQRRVIEELVRTKVVAK